MEQRALTRREFLVLSGSGLMAAGMLGPQAVLAQSTTIRQGYQTNIWGMPTYYLLRSGALEKRGLKFEEFAVPSGNLTMQQMVARQVDLGTYAGQSFVTGYDKGGLVAIAQIEHVGKTAQVMARKELKVTKVAELKGMKIGNQVGSSIGNTFVDIIAPRAGLKKEDYQEVKMNVNEMVAAAAAKSIDAFVSVDPYCSIAEAEGIATTVVSLYDYDPMPVYHGGHAGVCREKSESSGGVSESLARCRERLQAESRQGGRSHLYFFHVQGLHDESGDFQQGDGERRSGTRLPGERAALSATNRGRFTQGKEDQRDSGLEQGASSAVHGESPRLMNPLLEHFSSNCQRDSGISYLGFREELLGCFGAVGSVIVLV